ncbi:MAG TPA: homocysteine S-methyltransferase family protein [Jatrophihabitans sp.]|nr:homocysteine S-methyltransferase family protein [Jatrophihabitans sp.]
MLALAETTGDDMQGMTDGGLETTIIHQEGIELPAFAAFPLLESEDGRTVLRDYFEPYLAAADERKLAFVLDTPTWRANPDWGAQLGYDRAALAAANRRAVDFARELAANRPHIVVEGVLGPRGDGYVVGDAMNAEEAEDYHGWQIGVLHAAGVDHVTAVTLTYPAEAIGVVRAAAAHGAPVVISFTVETDGRLPDGTPLATAITAVDDATNGVAEFFMVNCAHPTHIVPALTGSPALARIGGLRVNASRMSHAELDASEELDQGDPVALGRDHAALHDQLPHIQVLGGCCGTDHRHVIEIVDAWPDRSRVDG